MKRTWALAVLGVLVVGTGLSAQEDTGTDACPTTIPAAPFGDIEHLPAESVAAIRCIAHYGIAAGTGPTAFSPDAPVSRSEMARFLVRTAGALGIELPPGETSPFEDIDSVDEDGRRSISRLWELGITRGTGSGTFDPERPVSRRQMALFLSRLLEVAEAPAATSEALPYTDLDGLSAGVVSAIEHLAGLGIEWAGSSELFEPARSVTREEMALLLASSLDAGEARHVRLDIELSASNVSTAGAVVATVTAAKPDGAPYRGLPVDVFVSQGHRHDGSCRVDPDAHVNGVDGGTSVDCRIDKADPRTDSSGEVRVGLAHAPVPETDRVFAWVGPMGQDYDDGLPDQVWVELKWVADPDRLVIEDPVDEEFGELVEIKARLIGQNVGRQRLVLIVVRQGVPVYTRGATTSFRGMASFNYRGPPDPSNNNDREVVEVVRVFWDRNRNGVYDGPAELSDETTATWDD